MITLDTTSISDGTDEIYSVDKGSLVKVFIDGVETKGCVYCNLTKGVAICLKRDLSGSFVVANGEIVYELIFGTITVKPTVEQ